jgi:prepilin-type N-terminal cleavage/methylation domain-containing protein
MQERLRKMQEARKDEKGFTLIELLIVIVILGVLAGIVVFSVKGITDRGEASACKSEVATVQTAEEANYAQLGAYATLANLKAHGFLHSDTGKYVTAASATDGSLTLATDAPASCSA